MRDPDGYYIEFYASTEMEDFLQSKTQLAMAEYFRTAVGSSACGRKLSLISRAAKLNVNGHEDNNVSKAEMM